MAKPWIVRHRGGWCALPPGAEPDPEAWSDPTLCGHVVNLRSGTGNGKPDCPDCLALLADPEAQGSTEGSEVMTGIIRWEDSGYAGGLLGFVGSMEPWAFQIWTSAADSRCQLMTALPIVPAGTERPESTDPEELKAKAEELLAAFAASLGAIFPGTLRQQVQQARVDYYEQACDHGGMTGHESQQERAFGRVEALDEVLGMLAEVEG